MDYILVFGSVHKALKAESILKRASIPFRLLPAPKALVPECDLVVSVTDGSLASADAALKRKGLRLKAVYRKEDNGYVKV